jgi:hypothetical protein
MSLSKERKRHFVGEFAEILGCKTHRLSTNDEKAREQFLTWVYEANLTEDREELFLLGGLAERYYMAVSPNKDPKDWLKRL